MYPNMKDGQVMIDDANHHEVEALDPHGTNPT